MIYDIGTAHNPGGFESKAKVTPIQFVVLWAKPNKFYSRLVSTKKKDFTNILFWTFEPAVLWYDCDVVSMLGFHFQVAIFAIKLQIKSDFYLYVKRSVS